MPTLVLSRRYSDDSNTLWRAALDAGWDVERLLSYDVPVGLSERDPVLYGETLFADAVADPLGITLLEPTYAWLPDLPFAYRKRDIRLARLGEVREIDGPTFIKPVDEKIFAARVYRPEDRIDSALDDGAAVLVSEPVNFGLEVRAFIAARKVVCFSAYMRDGDVARSSSGEWPMTREETDGALGLLESLVADPAVELPPAVVIDVGLAEGLGYVVVEANPCWGAGLCDCDPRLVLSVIRRASVPLPCPAEDQIWSRTRHLSSSPG